MILSQCYLELDRTLEVEGSVSNFISNDGISIEELERSCNSYYDLKTELDEPNDIRNEENPKKVIFLGHNSLDHKLSKFFIL